jgi:hypothetical protein
MPERWRSNAARKLVQAIRAAGGQAERAGVGRIKVTGPAGTVTIHEPSGDSRRDLRRESAARKIEEATGLPLTEADAK